MMRKRLSTGVFEEVPEELRKLPPLGLDVLVRIVLPILAIAAAILLALTSCAHKPDVGDAVKGANLAMGFVREAADELDDVHQVGTEAAIAYCRATVREPATEEQRTACLEKVGFSPAQIEEHRKALEQLRDAYDSIADALELVDTAWPILQRMAERAKAVPR